MSEEKNCFRHLRSTEQSVPREYVDRLIEEWREAKTILVNSEWSRRAVTKSGVSAGKVVVVPLGYDPPPVQRSPRPPIDTRHPLRVLWLGSLCLRKGLPYAVEAAQLLANEPIEFTFVGPSFVDIAALRLPAKARYLGRVARAEAAAIFARHDVFLFPTLSDGFGLTQLEAQAHGLPAVVTRNCGDVVVDGVTGYVVPVRDAVAIASALRLLAVDRTLATMTEASLEGARRFSLDRIAAALVSVLLPKAD